MKKIIFFDTETTGVDSTDFLCQLAYKTGDEIFCELFKPEIKIPPEASSVHHITNKMVQDKPSFKESPEYQKIKKLFEDEDSIVVAHNAKFDLAIIEKENIKPKKVICTLRVARALDKENKIPQHKLQFLRYYLDIEIEATAHDALGDVLVLEKLFERLLNKIKETDNLNDEEALKHMIEVSARPSLMYSFSFGKYNGKTVEDVARIDPGYLKWFLDTKEKDNPGDEDWIYTLKHHLAKK